MRERFRTLCDVHQEMSAYVITLDNPYFAVVPDPRATAEKAGPDVLMATEPFLAYLALLHGESQPVAEGIPVVGYDRLIEDPGVFYLTFDNKEVGRI